MNHYKQNKMKGAMKSGLIFFLISLVLFASSLFFFFKKPAGAGESSQVSEKSSKVAGFKFNGAVGKNAPDFALSDISGDTVKLTDYKGKFVVLFFTEGAMCYPACWDQISAFEKDERFNSSDVTAFSIVVDEKSEWQEIIKQAPEFSKAKILFDSQRIASTAYNILSLPSSMHPPSEMHPGGYPGHTYFIIDKDGVIGWTFDDPSMGLRNDLIFSEISKLKGV